MKKLILQIIFGVACVTIGIMVGGGMNKPDQQGIDIMKARHNINCPLRFYIENDKLIVKSFSCTLNDLSGKNTKGRGDD